MTPLEQQQIAEIIEKAVPEKRTVEVAQLTTQAVGTGGVPYKPVSVSKEPWE